MNKKKKKVLLNYSAFRKSYLAGVAVYSKEILKEILQIDTNNDYLILMNREVMEYFDISHIQNIEIIELSSIFKIQIVRIFYEIFIMPIIVKKKKIDIIFTPYVSTSVFSKCRKVTVIHDIMPLIIRKYPYIRQQFVKFMMFISMKYADKIITVSQNSLKDLEKYYKNYSYKISYIHNGVRCNTMQLIEKQYRVKYNFSYILFVGTLQPSKNLDRLIKAYSFIHENIYEKLLIVGAKGWQKRSNLTEKIDQLGLQKKILFTGYVDDEELIYLYKNAKFLAYPSLYEGFGFPPLEAMQYGTAVLASNVSSIPEVCGDAALYIDPYDEKDISEKMLLLCTDVDINKNLTIKGKKQVKKFTWEKNVQSLLEIFDEMVAK